MTHTLIEIIGTTVTVAAIAGVVLNNHRLRACFIVWLFTNGITAGIHAHAGIWSLVFRDVVFFGLAVHGWFMWGRKAKASPWTTEAIKSAIRWRCPKCDGTRFASWREMYSLVELDGYQPIRTIPKTPGDPPTVEDTIDQGKEPGA